MRFPFRHLPDPLGPGTRARPLVDVVVEGLDLAPQACLLDTGATAIRLGRHVADLVGVDLADAPTTRITVGGGLVEARMARAGLELAVGPDRHRWEAPVWFCEPWRPGFGLLGLTGFFDQFLVTLDAYDEWIELSSR